MLGIFVLTFIEVQHISEHQKSASFISTNTTEDNDKLIQSTVSIEGHTAHPDEEGEGHQGEFSHL